VRGSAPFGRGFCDAPVTVRSLESAKCWSEWQDFDPPRPERGALPDYATLRFLGKRTPE